MPLTEEQQKNLEVFDVFGLSYKMRGGQAVSDCPYCDARRKLYIDPDTTKYECKVCGERGNNYTFLTRVLEVYQTQTTGTQLRRLSELRDGYVPSSTFKRFGVVQLGGDSDDYGIPVYNRKGTAVNVRRWNPSNGIMYNFPGFASALFNLKNYRRSGPLYLCEGEWDAIGLDWLLRRNKEKGYTVLAAPGASTFKSSWTKYFEGRDVTICYDNDNPGREGVERVLSVLSTCRNRPNVSIIKWPEEYPDKYDIRDFVSANRKRPSSALSKLLSYAVPWEPDSSTGEADQPRIALERNSFQEVLADFEDCLNVTDEFRDALACVFAVVASVVIPGDPLWLMLVGPPGSGKTTIIEAFEWCQEQTEHHSTLTAKTLVTGMKVQDSEGSTIDTSLIPQLDGRSLFIKDLTAILSKALTVQDELFGLLRDLYDGRFHHQFGNGKICHYEDFNFGMVAGVTEEINRFNRAALGERFIKINIVPDDFDPEDNIRSALGAISSKKAFQDKLKASVLGFARTLSLDLTNLPTVPGWINEQLVALVQIVAYLRTKVHRDNAGISYRPKTEVATRLAKQLNKLAISLAYVMGKDQVDVDCYNIVKRVALNTCVGIPLEVATTIMRKRKSGVTKQYVADTLQLGKTQIGNILRDMQELQIMQYSKVSNNSGFRGRNAYVWRPTKSFDNLWKRAQVYRGRPKSSS